MLRAAEKKILQEIGTQMPRLTLDIALSLNLIKTAPDRYEAYVLYIIGGCRRDNGLTIIN